jgi:hypothetical protein
MFRWKPETLRLHPWRRTARTGRNCTLIFFFPRCPPRSRALAAVERRRRTSNADPRKGERTEKKGGSRVGGSRSAYPETLFSPGSAVLMASSTFTVLANDAARLGSSREGLGPTGPCCSVADGKSPMLQQSLGLLEGRAGQPSRPARGIVVRSQYHWSRFQLFFQRPHKTNGRAQRSGHLTWGMCPFSIGSLPLGSEGKMLKGFPSRHW